MKEKDFEEAYRSYQEQQLPDGALIKETLSKIENTQRKSVFTPLVRYSALAASAVLVVATVLVAGSLGRGDVECHEVSSPDHLNNPTLMTSSTPNSTPSSEAISSVGNQLSIPSQSVESTTESVSAPSTSDQINLISGLPSAALPCLSPENYRWEKLNQAALFDYLGKRVDPLVPEGLVPTIAENERVWEFVIDRKTNEPYIDFCGFAYADKFLEPGIPSADARVLHVIVSKKGWHFGVYYAEKEPTVTHAYGVDITWGKVIDRPTYTAEFQADGIQYTIWGENLSLDELHTVVKSLVD